MRTRFLMLFLWVATLLPAQSYSDYVDCALGFLEQDSLVQAERYFKRALRLQPAHPYNAIVYARLGAIQQRMHRYDEALESYDFSLYISPKSVSTLLWRGGLLFEMGELHGAYVDYAVVLDLEPDNVKALLLTAHIATKQGDYRDARSKYEHLLKLEPTHYAALFGLAVLNEKEESYADALSNYAALIAAYPIDSTIYVVRAQLYLAQKEKALALDDLEQAVALGAEREELRDLYKQCK